MTLTRHTMTDEQRKSVALEYLKAFDNGGVTSAGESTLDPDYAGRDTARYPVAGVRDGARRRGRITVGISPRQLRATTGVED
jgi:hypothetical protein